MTPDEFRKAGRQAIDWIADYLETIEQHPVLSQVEPGDVRRTLPPSPPMDPEPFEAILGDLDRLILPGITHWQSPNFFAYFPGNASPPAILGELLSAGLAVQGMSWVTSPACTELETHVLDWLVDALGLPDRFLSSGSGGGVIQDTASSSTLCALLAARERCGAPLSEQRIYASTQAHSSVAKGARVAGYRPEQVGLVDVDEALGICPEHLRRSLAADVEAGHTPVFVCATVGTTSTGAVDPVPAVAEACAAYGPWLHVDAAYAGSAAICPELRAVNAGLEHADSYCFNPHKWLLTNFDCSAMWVADREPLLHALSIQPEYLRSAPREAGAVIDYRDWHVPLGRRFRALKLWFVLRSYGIEGLRAHIRRHVAMAADLAERVHAHPYLELAAPVFLGLVCFRHCGGDGPTQALMDRLNASGRLYLTHTRVAGQLVLRMAIGARLTEPRHVQAAWDQIAKAAAAL